MMKIFKNNKKKEMKLNIVLYFFVMKLQNRNKKEMVINVIREKKRVYELIQFNSKYIKNNIEG